MLELFSQFWNRIILKKYKRIRTKTNYSTLSLYIHIYILETIHNNLNFMQKMREMENILLPLPSKQHNTPYTTKQVVSTVRSDIFCYICWLRLRWGNWKAFPRRLKYDVLFSLYIQYMHTQLGIPNAQRAIGRTAPFIFFTWTCMLCKMSKTTNEKGGTTKQSGLLFIYFISIIYIYI